MLVLVTGGVRSGKSRHAEALLDPRPAVRYVATGPPATGEDADWAARIRAHQERRPAHWSTLETHDLPVALDTSCAVLVDCLGNWLTAVLDAGSAWDEPTGALLTLVEAHVEAALGSVRGDVVWVTNEVGLGVVPAHRSGRVFRDLLGVVNQRVAAACDEVHLVVAGRTIVL